MITRCAHGHYCLVNAGRALHPMLLDPCEGGAMDTPTTPAGLRQFDQLDPVEAVIRAWLDAGSYPAWHEQMRVRVRAAMPVLARALDRLADE